MALEIPDEVRGAIHQAWLPALMTALLADIRELPQEHREALLTKMCTTCEDLAMAGALGIQPGMSWDQYVEFLKGTIPPIGPWNVRRDGDVYDLVYDSSVDEQGRPRCHCPLVQLGMMEPNAFCCSGGTRLAGRMIEGAAGRPVARAELIDSPLATGKGVCHYRVHVK
jgi:hypothetical protein